MGIVLVKKKSLDTFLRKDGYQEVQFVNNSWRGIAEASRKTGIAEMTIRRLLKEHPTPPKEIGGRQVWLTPLHEKMIDETISNLKAVSKKLKNFEKYLEKSLIIDLSDFQARKELNGLTVAQFQDELRKQIETGEKNKSQMEKLFSDTLEDFNSSLKTLTEIDNSLRAAK